MVCSLMSASCCWSFCTSLRLVSFPLFFVLFPAFTAFTLLAEELDTGVSAVTPGFESTSGWSACTPDLSLFPSFPPQHTKNGILSSMGSLHSTQRFITAAQAVHATMWLQGLNRVCACTSVHTVQS